MLAFERFYQGFGRLLSWVAIVNGGILFLLMWLISANALSRKAFNLPLQGTVEFTGALMPLITLLPLAYTQFRQGHIKVDLVVSRLHRTVQRGLEALALLLALGFFVWISYATLLDALGSYAMDETAWGIIRFEIWPTKFAIVLGSVLMTIQLLLDLIRLVSGVKGAGVARLASHG